MYEVLRFGDDCHLGINEAAHFFAFIGVTMEEAEQWRPWAAAYINMELEEHPESDHAQMLHRARQQMHTRINNNPDWVIARVYPTSPGYYNPGMQASLPVMNTGTGPSTITSTNAEAGPSAIASTNVEAGPSTTTAAENIQVPDLLDVAIEDGEVSISFRGEQDKDMVMGPG
jgi:hypothetical protein